MTISCGHTQIRLQGAEMENILTKYSLKYCKVNSVLFLLKYCEKLLKSVLMLLKYCGLSSSHTEIP